MIGVCLNIFVIIISLSFQLSLTNSTIQCFNTDATFQGVMRAMLIPNTTNSANVRKCFNGEYSTALQVENPFDFMNCVHLRLSFTVDDQHKPFNQYEICFKRCNDAYCLNRSTYAVIVQSWSITGEVLKPCFGFDPFRDMFQCYEKFDSPFSFLCSSDEGILNELYCPNEIECTNELYLEAPKTVSKKNYFWKEVCERIKYFSILPDYKKLLEKRNKVYFPKVNWKKKLKLFLSETVIYNLCEYGYYKSKQEKKKKQDVDKDKPFDFLFKITLILIGDICVGKYSDEVYNITNCCTIGVDFKIRTLRDLKRERDTAGQERFRTITNAYYKGAKGILLFFDLTLIKSFNSLKDWYEQVSDFADEDAITILCGTKCDLVDRIQVDKTKIEQWVKEKGNIKYFETSAKENINVKHCFHYLTREIIECLFKKYPPSKDISKIDKKNMNKKKCIVS